MPMLTLKQTIQTTSQGSQVWITDATGPYSSPSNVGGWGAPNPNLNQTALVGFIQLSTPDGLTPLVPISSAIAFNASDTNSTVRTIGFNYGGDGHEKAYLFAVPVSNDGVTTLAGHVLVANEYYCLSGNAVYKKAASGPDTLITDYSVLIGDMSIVQNLSHAIFFNQLTIKNELQYYRQYRDARTANDVETADYLRKVMDDLRIDLQGAFWQFSAGLYTQAEDIVAELVERHSIIDSNIIPVL